MLDRKVFLSKTLILLGFVLCGFFSTYGQNTVWYFGNGAGIDFSSGAPKSINSGKLFTDEGSAVAVDKDGKLLFYTNGVEVYDKNHGIMPKGMNIGGNRSSSQVAIAPYPGKPHLYYIFTVGEKALDNSLKYSVVDLSKKEGLGEVILTKNVTLGAFSEKLLVVPHQNGKDFWLITHKWNSDEFSCFQVNASGVSSNPVVSKAGSFHRDIGKKDNSPAIGYMVISPDGKRIAVASCYKPNAPIEVFKFSNETGTLIHEMDFPSSGFAYGLCFSPNGHVLYASFLKGKVNLIQYDLNNKNQLENSYEISSNEEDNVFGGIQMGPDKKLYVSRVGKTIDIIEQPNTIGVGCKYVKNGFQVIVGSATYGLPSFLINLGTEQKTETPKTTTVTATKEPVKNVGKVCGAPLTLNAGKVGFVYLWSTGETTQRIKINTQGVYTVQISSPVNIASETISFNVTEGYPKVNLGKDTTLECASELILNAKNNGVHYIWSTGDTTQTVKVLKSGFYSVKAYKGDCIDEDTIKVTFSKRPAALRTLPSFSPRNTGFNTFFDFSLDNVTEFELKVLSPKGKVVYKSKDIKERWKGTDSKGKNMPVGDYKWIFKYKNECSGDDLVIKEGVVKLL